MFTLVDYSHELSFLRKSRVSQVKNNLLIKRITKLTEKNIKKKEHLKLPKLENYQILSDKYKN